MDFRVPGDAFVVALKPVNRSTDYNVCRIFRARNFPTVEFISPRGFFILPFEEEEIDGKDYLRYQTATDLNTGIKQNRRAEYRTLTIISAPELRSVDRWPYAALRNGSSEDAVGFVISVMHWIQTKFTSDDDVHILLINQRGTTVDNMARLNREAMFSDANSGFHQPCRVSATAEFSVLKSTDCFVPLAEPEAENDDLLSEEFPEYTEISLKSQIQCLLERTHPFGLETFELTTISEIERTMQQLIHEGVAEKLPGGEFRKLSQLNQIPGIPQRRPLIVAEPTVAIITLIPAAFEAACSIISAPQPLQIDGRDFWIGDCGGHRVVVTQMDSALSSLTTRLIGQFPAVTDVFIFCSGGGIPNFRVADEHLFLSDVILGTTYIRVGEESRKLKTEKWISESEKIPKAFRKCDFQELSRLSADDSLGEALDMVTIDHGFGDLIIAPHPISGDSRSRVQSLNLGSVADSDGGNVLRSSENQFAFNHLTEYLNVRCVVSDEVSSILRSLEGSRVDSFAVCCGITDYENGKSERAEPWLKIAASATAAVIRQIIEQIGGEETAASETAKNLKPQFEKPLSSIAQNPKPNLSEQQEPPDDPSPSIADIHNMFGI